VAATGQVIIGYQLVQLDAAPDVEALFCIAPAL
jgi:hypothetical protein